MVKTIAYQIPIHNLHEMSLLQVLQRANHVRMVQTGEVQAMSWTEKNAIGTNNMGSGIAVIIATDFAVVLAHIPQRASMLPENSSYAGESHVKSMMDKVHNFYHDGEYFPWPTEVQAYVCAWVHEDAPADQEQDAIDCLWEMGLEPIHVRRIALVIGTNGPTNGATNAQLGEGECLAVRGTGGSPLVFMNDELVRYSRR